MAAVTELLESRTLDYDPRTTNAPIDDQTDRETDDISDGGKCLLASHVIDV